MTKASGRCSKEDGKDDGFLLLTFHGDYDFVGIGVWFVRTCFIQREKAGLPRMDRQGSCGHVNAWFGIYFHFSCVFLNARKGLIRTAQGLLSLYGRGTPSCGLIACSPVHQCE
jgi:hypothetical protein